METNKVGRPTCEELGTTKRARRVIYVLPSVGLTNKEIVELVEGRGELTVRHNNLPALKTDSNGDYDALKSAVELKDKELRVLRNELDATKRRCDELQAREVDTAYVSDYSAPEQALCDAVIAKWRKLRPNEQQPFITRYNALCK